MLVTGHTGFVGGWTCAWLDLLGARVTGFSKAPPTQPSFFERTGIGARLSASLTGDINEPAALAAAFRQADPEVVIHLAAQPIVREAFREPHATFATNVLGTVNVLEACRKAASLRSVVAYTTDKVYRNDQSGRAFAEGDPLGGNEPYSASKAAADWAAASYWESYFRPARRISFAIVRAGNLVGGGDWAAERLVPDAIRAFQARRPLVVRNPQATRPWQHVVDVVRATLVLAERAPLDAPGPSQAWNLGPDPSAAAPVREVAERLCRAWGEGAEWRHEPDGSIAEAKALALDSRRARDELGWRCAWDLGSALEASLEWYRADLAGGERLLDVCARQVEANLRDAA